jgi:preprotein translocase subunit YajC
LTPILFLVLILGLAWFLLIAPSRRRQQQARDARESVDPGDVILTAGGIYATVKEVRDGDLDVEIAPGTTVRLDKRAIAIVVEPVDSHEEAGEEPEAEPEEAATPDEEPSAPART